MVDNRSSIAVIKSRNHTFSKGWHQAISGGLLGTPDRFHHNDARRG